MRLAGSLSWIQVLHLAKIDDQSLSNIIIHKKTNSYNNYFSNQVASKRSHLPNTMKSFILAFTSFLIANGESTSRLRGGGTISSSSLIGRSKNKYELKKVFEVEGRQGIATNGTHYFNSASKGLYVYDMEGNLLNKNEK